MDQMSKIYLQKQPRNGMPTHLPRYVSSTPKVQRPGSAQSVHPTEWGPQVRRVRTTPPRVAHAPSPSPASAANSDATASPRETTAKETVAKEILKPVQQTGDVTTTKEKTVVVTSGKHSHKNGEAKKGESSAGGYKPKVTLPYYMEPTYFIGGGNGVALIEEVMNDLGWKRIKEKNDDSYKLKWVELKGTINYYTFKEGDQLVNHIPNCNLLTNKLGLVNSLQDYERMALHYRKRGPRLDFLPETFKLDDPRDREAFRNTYKEGDMYICKPTGRNQGKGIFLVKTPQEVQKVFEEQEEKTAEGKPVKPLNRIMQRYLHRPLLLNKKKFDIRAYMLVASTVPFLVLYHKGYIRLSIQDYDNDSDSLIAHLTNQFIQKKDPSYKDVKDDTTWSMERLNDYVNENIFPDKDIEKDWVFNTLETRMKQIMTYCFNAVKHKLACKVGYFDLYGFDFMVEDDMKVWLIEVNVNPTLATNCVALKEVIPPVVSETIHIALECFEKSRKGKALMPVQSIKNFHVLVNTCPRSGPTASKKDPSRSKSMSPQGVRRSVTYSPTKEPTIVAMSSDVSKSVGQAPKVTPYGYVNNRGNGVSLRQMKNTPRATPTVATGTSSSVNAVQRPTTNNSNSSNKEASANSKSINDSGGNTNQQKSTNDNLGKPENKEVSKVSAIASSSTGLSSNKANRPQMSQNTKSTSAHQNKSNSATAKEQTVNNSGRVKPGTFTGKVTGTVKQTVDKTNVPTRTVSMRKETNASYKVIVKETKLPAETQIVIVDNKSKTEITDEPKKTIKTPKTPVNPPESAKRQSSVRELSPKQPPNGARTQQNQIESDNQSVRSKWSSDLKTNGRSSSQKIIASSESRKSPYLRDNAKSKTPVPENRRKSGKHRDLKDVETMGMIESDMDRTQEPKKINVYYTGHGTPTGIIHSDSITPVDSSTQPVSLKYATVFPISPYTEPVAQFKMTHRHKKSKPKTDDKSFRGS